MKPVLTELHNVYYRVRMRQVFAELLHYSALGKMHMYEEHTCIQRRKDGDLVFIKDGKEHRVNIVRCIDEPITLKDYPGDPTLNCVQSLLYFVKHYTRSFFNEYYDFFLNDRRFSSKLQRSQTENGRYKSGLNWVDSLEEF